MTIQIDRRIYSDNCVSKVVYWLSGQYTILRNIDGDKEIVCIENVSVDPSLEKEFYQRLNEYKLREVIENETKDIKTILYAKAFGDFDDLTEEEITE